MGNLIPWELCHKFDFDHTKKSNMRNLESDQENETHKILRDFDIRIT